MLAHNNSNDIRKKIENYSFSLSDRIGKGYSSTVYKGRNDLTDQVVAIKVIELKSLRDEVSRKLLKFQLQCIRTINHENLLKYIDSYETVNNCYIITEFCEGGDMEKELRKKLKYTQVELKNIFLQFYAGYKHFLEAGYIHRDLKPANIFLQKGQLKIADFGFVKKLGQNPKQSYNVGTPIYMPPQSLTSNIYTEKSDVWSIGVICYQLTHGKLPFRGINQAELKNNIQLKNVVFESGLISKQLQNFISLCLEKNPANRPAINEMLNHPWMQKIRQGPNPQTVTPSYLLPNLKIKKPQQATEETTRSEKGKATKYSTLDHLVSILNYLRFIFKVYKFISENKIQFKETLKKLLLQQLINTLQEKERMVETGQNSYKLQGWEEFKKSSKWKVYKGVVEQYSEKYRKLEIDKQNIPTSSLKSYIYDLLLRIKHLKSIQIGNKAMFRNIEALDYLISLESFRSLCERDGWQSLLQKSPINNIVECRCQVDVQNYIEVLKKLQNKVSYLY